MEVSEREVSIHELISASREDRLLEMFGASTHTLLLPIRKLVFQDTTMLLNQHSGEFFKQLSAMLLDLMCNNQTNPYITSLE